MEKLIIEHQAPSLAAGNPLHMSFLMGDWNVLFNDFKKDARDANTAAGQDLQATTVCATNTQQRDLVAVFNTQWQWEVTRNDDHYDEALPAFHDGYGQEHQPLFFSLNEV